METSSPISSGHARGARGRRDPARVRALRLLHRDLPDLPVARRRTRRAARTHLPDQADARRCRRDREHAAAPRSLPHLPQLRNDVSLRRALWSPRRHRSPASSTQKVEPQRRASATTRWLLRKGLTNRGLFGAALAADASLVRPLLPRALAARRSPWPRPPGRGRRGVIRVACSCSMVACSPRWRRRSTSRWRARSTGSTISLVRADGGGCCGAISEHLGAHERSAATTFAATSTPGGRTSSRAPRRFCSSASGCGVVVKDYGYLLRDDARYADKARRISELARDPVEIIAARVEAICADGRDGSRSPARRVPVAVLAAAWAATGWESRRNPRGHRVRTDRRRATGTCVAARPARIRSCRQICRGRLRANKLAALEAGDPSAIVTANIGCLTHLASGTHLPVRHWIDVFEGRLRSRAGTR